MLFDDPVADLIGGGILVSIFMHHREMGVLLQRTNELAVPGERAEGTHQDYLKESDVSDFNRRIVNRPLEALILGEVPTANVRLARSA